MRLDQARVVLLAVLGVAQSAVAIAAANGGLGTPVGEVARSHPTPLLAATWAFTVWIPIYVGFLAYAGYQCLPRQRHRHLHRRTGWWLAVSAVCNAVWVLTWSGGMLALAELMLIGMLVTTAAVFGRLSRETAASVAERIVFRTPVAVYTGWVSTAIVTGTATTGAWAGLPGDTAIASVAAVIVLAAVAAIIVWVILNGTAVVGYAAAVVWALAAIVLNEPPVLVAVSLALVLAVVLVATLRRIGSSADRTRAAFG